jgi:hypothetical protein
MRKQDFPFMSLNTDIADISLYLDGSIEVGEARLELEVVQQLIAFLAMPGVTQVITDASLKKARTDFLIDFQEAIRDEREVA